MSAIFSHDKNGFHGTTKDSSEQDQIVDTGNGVTPLPFVDSLDGFDLQHLAQTLNAEPIRCAKSLDSPSGRFHV